MNSQSIDISAFEQLLEIAGSDKSFIKELIDSFINTTQEQLSHLEQAIAKGDNTLIVEVAHMLKSSSAQLGALPLSELFKSLEILGRTDNPEQHQMLGEQIKLEFVKVQQDLNNLA